MYCLDLCGKTGVGSFRGFILVFPTIADFTVQTKKSKQHLCQLSNMNMPIINVGTGKINTGCVCGPSELSVT